VTWLIAGSIAGIVASALALGFGWLNASALLVWVSITFSVAAAVLLALAYSRSRAEAASPPAIDPPDRVRVHPADRNPGQATAEMALFDEDSGMGPPGSGS
jgi:hypothetical protein